MVNFYHIGDRIIAWGIYVLLCTQMHFLLLGVCVHMYVATYVYTRITKV